MDIDQIVSKHKWCATNTGVLIENDINLILKGGTTLVRYLALNVRQVILILLGLEKAGMSPGSLFRQPHCAHNQLWLLSMQGYVHTTFGRANVIRFFYLKVYGRLWE